jgi:hypothetical protein
VRQQRVDRFVTAIEGQHGEVGVRYVVGADRGSARAREQSRVPGDAASRGCFCASAASTCDVAVGGSDSVERANR